MRICVDLTSLADNFSGLERYALSITKELIKNRSNHWILLFKNSIHPDFQDVADNVTRGIINGRNKLFFNQFLLPMKLLFIKADKYFFPAFPAPFFFFNKNSITTIHDLGCWDCPITNKPHMIAYFKLMYWKASLNNKKIVTVSRFSKSRIEDILGVKGQNISVIHSAVENRFLNFEEKKPTDVVTKKYNLPKKYILCLSTLEPRKNLKLLIKAYSNICNQVDCSLVLAGRKGWMIDDLLDGVSDDLRRNIYFTGFIDDEDLPAIYNLAVLFVFPSLYEGFGLPPLEAMGCGTCVLSSDAASLPEVLGDAAFYFKSNCQESLEYELLHILTMNENELEKMRSRGRNRSHTYRFELEARRMEKEHFSV